MEDRLHHAVAACAGKFNKDKPVRVTVTGERSGENIKVQQLTS